MLTADHADAGARPGLHDREAAFHDAWAAGTPLQDRLVHASFEAPTAPEHRFIVRLLRRTFGGLRGLRVVDVGCGLGEASVYFALQGAEVTATDVSPEMTRTTEALAAHHDARVRGVVSTAEDLQVEPGSFDVAYLGNVVHHVPDKDAMWRQVATALRPGGLFVSWDPLRYNPAINLYRRMATGVRTEDEFPLGFGDVAKAGRYFEDVRHREFWIATLALFGKYYLLDRVHPNDDRYWKRILRETSSSLWWWRPLAALDAGLTRVPVVRRLAWNMVMWGRRRVRPEPMSGPRARLADRVLPALKRALVPAGLRLGSFHAYPPRPMAMPPPAPPLTGPLPIVSIVTPSYNQGRFLAETMRSVLSQCYPRVEYIVMDGGSSDGSDHVIRGEAARLAFWSIGPDGGQAEAINRGFARSTGDIMAWLNADDLLLPGAVASAVDVFKRRPEVDVVYGHRVIIDEETREVGRWVLPTHRRAALLWRDYIPQETMFWRRRIWDRIGGGLAADFRFAMDWELVGRFDRAGARFCRLPRFLGAFRTHGDQKSLTLRRAVGEAEFEKVRRAALPTGPSRAAARVGGLAYLAESAVWTWADAAGLAVPGSGRRRPTGRG